MGSPTIECETGKTTKGYRFSTSSFQELRRRESRFYREFADQDETDRQKRQNADAKKKDGSDVAG